MEGDDAAAAASRIHGCTKIHAVALPYPAQGHITPMMQLCTKLASSGRFSITFVNSQHNHHRLQISQRPSVPSGLDIRMVCIPDGLPPDHPRTGNLLELTQATEDAMALAFEQLVEQLLLRASPPLSVIISDVVMPCSQAVANKFGLPRVALRTASAASHTLYYHVPQLISDGVLPIQGGSDAAVFGKSSVFVPGLPPLHPSCIPSVLLDKQQSDYFREFTIRVLNASRRAAWLIVNSFHDLESKAIDSMKTKLPIFPVGPLLPLNNKDIEQSNSVGTALWAEEHDFLQWLNAQPAFSVIYISFGSIATLSPTQINELALGLEASQQPFLWVYRPDLVNGTHADLLEAFSSRTKEWGRIISWAPQLRVLGHPSVGAFISHCGWNSCLESISMGVPMLAWPSFGDQNLNATLVVEEWKVGMNFVPGRDGIVGRKEVERVVRAAMVGEVGREIRIRVGKLKEAARRAVAEVGSSQRNLEAIVEDLERRVQTRLS